MTPPGIEESAASNSRSQLKTECPQSVDYHPGEIWVMLYAPWGPKPAVSHFEVESHWFPHFSHRTTTAPPGDGGELAEDL